MTSSIIDRAFAALPGYAAARAAERVLDEQLRGLLSTGNLQAIQASTQRELVVELAEAVLAGRGLPEDLAARAYEASLLPQRTAAAMEVVVALREELRHRRDVAAREGVDAALALLREELAELVAQAAPVLAALGGVRTAEEALASGDAAVEALKAARGLAGRYGQLRGAQAQVMVAAAVGTGPDVRSPRWGGLLLRDALARFGHFAEETTTEETTTGEPADPVQRLCVAVAVAGAAQVPPFAEVRRRAEVAAAQAQAERLADVPVMNLMHEVSFT